MLILRRKKTLKEFAEEDCIALICNGEFDDVPGTPIGELFEEFFDNINYNVVKENDGFVDLTGDAFCDDEPCTILIRFKILEDLDTFEISDMVKEKTEEIATEFADKAEDIAMKAASDIIHYNRKRKIKKLRLKKQNAERRLLLRNNELSKYLKEFIEKLRYYTQFACFCLSLELE